MFGHKPIFSYTGRLIGLFAVYEMYSPWIPDQVRYDGEEEIRFGTKGRRTYCPTAICRFFSIFNQVAMASSKGTVPALRIMALPSSLRT